MDNWNSVVLTSTLNSTNQESDYDSELIRQIQFIRDPLQAYIDTHQKGFLIEQIEQYGTETGSFVSFDGDGYIEADKDSGITKDHIEARKTLLTFSLNQAVEAEAKEETNKKLLRFYMPEKSYKQFN